MAVKALLINPPMNTIIGNPMINKIAIITPATPSAAPVGSVALVALAKACDKAGIEPLKMDNKGNINAARKIPIIDAIIAPIEDKIKANEITGISVTSSPSNPNFIPPNLGTRLL